MGERGATALVPGATLPDARFFPDARLNVVETFLATTGDGPALIEAGEDGRRRTLTWDELRAQVAALAAALAETGVGPGDRVAAWLPNIPETIVTMLATAAVGAIFSSTSPDFGTAGVLDRFGQIEPTVLVAADGYVYGGKANRLPAPAGRDPRRPADAPPDDRGAVPRRRAPGRGPSAWPDVARRARRGRRSRPQRSPSTTPGTSSTRRAPPGCRSASSTAPAGCCSST